ncbi:MAG: hypothetical protein A4E65_01897 [Syntrophorhabdus sp. PtaU1.Bin153]|nr:MAG: hypothetical protein A4E65_01897 [Syntrophorhabdus sp. PtaU1.Bin153]
MELFILLSKCNKNAPIVQPRDRGMLNDIPGGAAW